MESIKKMNEQKWKSKTDRFVLFFDILGFKNMVSKMTHEDVLIKLNALKKTTYYLENPLELEDRADIREFDEKQTKCVTFSDSIIIFSKGNSYLDAKKILFDAHVMLVHAFRNFIPIKGALSYGEITSDFIDSQYFGQPIIDAYLLHEELNLLSVIVDHNAEKKIHDLGKNADSYNLLKNYRVPMKYGKVDHKLVCLSKPYLSDGIKNLNKLYLLTSGKTRIYIDNTIELLNWGLKE